MNKIFKVIYSKVRNCYVVTSEFAKANTKSSTGSTKSKTGKKALLTLAVASAIFCGGFVNVGATVHVNEVVGGTEEVYTKNEVDSKIDTVKNDVTSANNAIKGLETSKANASEVEDLKETIGNADSGLVKKTNDNANSIIANRTDINNLKNTVGDVDNGLVKKTADNEKDIASNKAEIGNLKDAVGNVDSGLIKKTNDNINAITDLTGKVSTKAEQSEVENLKNNTYTKSDIDNKLSAANDRVDTKLGEYAKTADVNAELAKKADADSVYSKTEADNTFTTKDELNAAKTELEGKITNNTTNITLNKEAIDDLKTKVGDATGGLTKTVNDLTGKVNTVESDITDLKDKDVALEGKINANSNDITALKNKDVELEGKIDNTKTELSNADTALDAKITANKDKIQQNTDNIAANKTVIDNLKNNVGTVTGGGYLDGSDTIAGNLGRLNTGLTDEVAARNAEDTALSNRIGKLNEDGTYIEKSTTNNVSENLKALDEQAKKNASATDKNTSDIQGNAEAIAKEIADRKDEDTKLDGKITATNTALNKQHFTTFTQPL